MLVRDTLPLLPVLFWMLTAQGLGQSVRHHERPTTPAESQIQQGSGLFEGSAFPCTPAPCVLKPRQITPSGNWAFTVPILADPGNPQHLLLGSEDGSCYSGPNTSGFLGFYISENGGSTWRHKCLPERTYLYFRLTPMDSPLVGYDENGVAFVAGHYYDTDYGCCDFLGLTRSPDGITWGPGQGLPYLYEPWLAIDTSTQSNNNGTIYISGVGGQIAPQIAVELSRDGGATWSQSFVNFPEKPNVEDDYTQVTTGKYGTVYVTWLHCATSRGYTGCGDKGDGSAFVFFSQSSDGGVHWSSPVVVTKVALLPTLCSCPIGTLPNTTVNMYNRPVLAVDNSDGPYAGWLYVATYTWTGTYMKVQVSRSTDGGKAWTEPVPVAPADDTHDQFMPWMSVSKNGLVGVSWLDRRNDPANTAYQAFAAISTDGARSFPRNVQLTNAFSNPNDENLGGYMGEYTGDTWAGSTFLASWMDLSSGMDSVDMVGGVRLR